MSFCYRILFPTCLIIQCLLFFPGFTQDQELLKTSDITKIMQEIFNEHVDKKEISKQILNHSFKIYIEQFDPNKIYLLNAEVSPWLTLSDEQLDKILTQYHEGNFSAYQQLNEMIQKAILRAQTIREELEGHTSELFADNSLSKQDLIEYSSYAQTSHDLKLRIQRLMQLMINQEKIRYGAAKVNRHTNAVIDAIDADFRDQENSYLYQDDHGQEIAANDKENLFTIHVLKALSKSLDAHTVFLNPQEAYEMRVHLVEGFHSLGVTLQPSAEGAIVNQILEGGPAEKTGLIKADDILTEMNGKSLKGLSLPAVLEVMKSNVNDGLNITLLRKSDEVPTGWKTVQVQLKEDENPYEEKRIEISSEAFGNGIIGEISLYSFYQNDNGASSAEDVKNAILNLNKNGNLRGLILDLRDNRGGFLMQAVKVAGLFITSGVIVVSKYSNGEERVYRDVDNSKIYNGPLIILTSKATASAAEIVAQTLKDYGVAIIAGDEHTYGKGTIQSQTVTQGKGSSYFKVTVGKYYTVSGKTPQITGVKSDIIVPSRYYDQPLGEQYLEYTLKSDKIAPSFNDDLGDVDPKLKPWYLKYYMPSIQKKQNTWEQMIPVLKKNSEYRIQHNKDYQLFLKKLKGEGDASEDDELNALLIPHVKNSGVIDLQKAEAVNIMKDIIYLEQKTDLPAHDLTPSESTS